MGSDDDILDGERPRPTALNDVNVAVIDDDELLTKLVERVLQHCGISSVYRITRPAQFLDMMAEGIGGIHLVVCDVGMPGIDGLEILRRVRDVNPDLPFLMLTADGKGDTVRQAIDRGVTAYLVKPLDPGVLRDKVMAALDRSYGIKP